MKKQTKRAPRLAPWLLGALLAASLGVRADPPLAIVALKHQTVERMLPLLRPFVEPGGTVTGMNGQLVIRTSPENLAELKTIIQRFDRAPRQLRITVRQGGFRRSERLEAGVRGRVEAGDEGSVIIGRPGPEKGLEGQVEKRYKEWSSEAERYVRATEGQPAFIQSGQSVPTYTHGLGPWGEYRVEERYRDVTSGFYVTPWVNGDRVTLEIAPFSAEPAGTPRHSRIQQITSRVTGRLGAWIAIGGTRLKGKGSRGATTSYATGSVEDQEPVEVKVELIEP